MQIPLDYYRILGLPVQATPEQLQQSHRDRLLQLPRREYSERSIAARRDLLDTAYETLADPDKREIYNAEFISGHRIQEGPENPEYSGRSENVSTTQLEIEDHQLIGALLVLHELGEYEQVLQVGLPALGNTKFHYGDAENLEIAYADTALTLALAYLELGREYWHQGHYESAGLALEAGQDLLLREGLFTSVRGEIKNDLYKLRPYRVLELVALPEDNVAERRKGIQILKDMLQERGGIDGNGHDQSGLSVDDFLRFIQQLRDYLTAEEQQALFQAEARRPSAVATYLAVYALLAQGFATHQPEQIHHAKTLLIRLGKRQDVHIEQAICALLLGQTEEASHALELSREYEAITFIREHSQGAPDLLPGLCLYAEQWLKNELFPHFRDLSNYQTTLKDYFADAQVQTYLEALPSEATGESNEWEVVPNADANLQTATSAWFHWKPLESSSTVLDPYEQSTWMSNEDAISRSPKNTSATPNANKKAVSFNPNVETSTDAGFTPDSDSRNGNVKQAPLRPNSGDSAKLTRRRRHPSMDAAPKVAPKNRLSQTSDPEAPNSLTSAPAFDPGRKRRSTPSRRPPVPASNASDIRSSKVRRLLFFAGTGALMLVMLGGLIFVTVTVVGWVSGSNNGRPEVLGNNEPLKVLLDRPLVVWPDNTDSPLALETPETLSKADAKRIVEVWLAAKREAMGVEHNTEPLDRILTGEELLIRQQSAKSAQREGFYVEYDHSVEIEDVQQSLDEPLLASIVALVNESAVFYENGTIDQLSSYNDQGLRVRYDLLREEEQWRIQSMRIIP